MEKQYTLYMYCCVEIDLKRLFMQNILLQIIAVFPLPLQKQYASKKYSRNSFFKLMNYTTSQNRHGFCYSLFLDSRCRCQIFYYSLKIQYTGYTA